MRTSSGDRRVRGFQNQEPKPNNPVRKDSVRNGVRDGMGRVGVSEEQTPLTERRAKEFQFVRSHLPEEHEGMAVSALISLQMRGRKPTKQQVLDRLAAQGRRSDQLREKGWMQ